jgi:lipopolysaccharide transport system ATP-binding protein
MSIATSSDAIVIRNVVKSFRKSTIRREYTTLKSELVRLLLGRRPKDGNSLITALRGIDLVIPRGKTVGIIGRNGSGKSTLLKMISGIYTPTSGTIDIHGRISALLDLGAGFHPDFSGRENILINGIILGMSRQEIRARMDEIIAFSELGDFIDEPVRTYSSGMYMRLAFSVATHVDPDILIIDEILAVGDEHFGKKSLAKMTEFKRAGKTIVIVTHDLGTLERWCDLGAWIDGGRIREFGPPADVIRSYRKAVELAEAQGLPMHAPALSPGGGALPSIEAEAPAPVPLASVELGAVRLLSQAGQQAEAFDTEDAVEVELDFTTRGADVTAGFGLALLRGDGSEVYRTSTFVDSVPVPAPLPEKGVLRLSLERLGLLPGDYAVEVSALTRADGEVLGAPVRQAFTVRSALTDSGTVRPPHRWRIERVEETPVITRLVGS